MSNSLSSSSIHSILTNTSSTTATSSRGTANSSTSMTSSSKNNSSKQQPQHVTTAGDDLDSIVGFVVAHYPCTYESMNGTLYAGTEALWFVGTYFLFYDKKVRLTWDQIRQVVHLEHPPGLQIWTKDDHVHSFGGIPAPARAWAILVSLHNDALLDVEHRPPPHRRQRLGSSGGTGGAGPAILEEPSGAFAVPRRRNSDPSSILNATTSGDMFDHEDEQDAGKNKKQEDTQKKEPISSNSKTVAAQEENQKTLQRLAASPIPDASKIFGYRNRTSAPSPSVDKNQRNSGSSKKGDTPPAQPPGLPEHLVHSKVGVIKMRPVRCRHKGTQGVLYTGHKALYFYGKKFFWDVKSALLPLGQIRQIQIVLLPTSTLKDSQPRSSGISIFTKDGVCHKFLDMDQADEVWANLLAIQNENLTRPSIALSRRTFQRTTSDPNLGRMLSFSENEGDLPNDDAPEGSGVAKDSQDVVRQLALLAPPAASSAAAPVAPVVKKSTKSAVPEKNSSAQVSTNSSRNDSGNKSNTANSNVNKLPETWEATIPTEKDYPHQVIVRRELNCTMDHFFDTFLSDSASHSIARYLESRGDSGLKTSPWRTTAVTPNGTSDGHRVIHYNHPVNAPLAPPLAGARKEQSFRRYGPRGLCLDTRTIVDDVPMADCFFVQDRVRVEATTTTKGKDKRNTVTVTMAFQINFIKPTMFQSIIRKTTKSEFTSFFKQMETYMLKALGEEPPKEETNPPKPEQSSSITWSSVLFGLGLLAIPGVLLFMYFELRDIKQLMAQQERNTAQQLHEIRLLVATLTKHASPDNTAKQLDELRSIVTTLAKHVSKSS